MTERSRELATGWIEAWIRLDMEWLRENLAPDFVHVSPFGRLEGREPYLAIVEPMARKSVMELVIKGAIADGERAAVWFENRTPGGVVETCDWIRVEEGRIRQIRSFYDPAAVRETLTPAEQKSLGGDTEPRTLYKEITIAASPDSVWNTWTTSAGLECVSSKSNVELRVGGPYEWFLDLPPDPAGRRGGEGARLLAFLPRQMLAFDWTFPPAVPALRASDARTQVVVLFDEVDDGVRIRFTQHGWQEGEDWDAGYDYFDEAWDYVLQTMKQHLEE